MHLLIKLIILFYDNKMTKTIVPMIMLVNIKPLRFSCFQIS